MGKRLRSRWDALIETEGAALGLAGCRPFLENKLVNDIFYEGLCNGRPCIVKCSSRAPEAIENEYRLAGRMHAVDPLHFPAVYAYHPGPFAFVVTEKIEGGRSLQDDPDEKYADEVLAILDSLFAAKVVHRDILPSNFLIGPDGHLKLIDFQFAVDMNGATSFGRWLERHPEYHYAVFACVLERNRAWWDDAAYAAVLLPSLRDRARSRRGRLRLEVSLSPTVRLRLWLYALRLRAQRLFAKPGSRRRMALDRRLERFK